MTRGRIKIGVKSEAELNREFLAAWERAKKGGIKEPDVQICFLDTATLRGALSARRVDLLKALRKYGPCSIRELARHVGRDFRNVYDDVQLFLRAGLVEKDAAGRVGVPWKRIQVQTDIDLAA
ncbi:MAG: hypothetical protein HYR98_07380 [Nitrospirae bacterium]|nr:hypothetical protein [Nitrospirota bacterium]MBI3393438.1 hypothetical protein [Nitrospirota bacterium]